MRQSAVQGRLDSEQQAQGAADVTLVDASSWPKFAVKGPNAAGWLSSQGVTLPERIYETNRPGADDLGVRTGSDEFVIQSENEKGLADRLTELCQSGDGVWPYPHEAATLQLSGDDSNRVWLQTCGMDFAQQPLDRIVYTRVAGVSCGVLPESRETVRTFRLWVPPSYAVYLTEVLLEIIADLDAPPQNAPRVC